MDKNWNILILIEKDSSNFIKKIIFFYRNLNGRIMIGFRGIQLKMNDFDNFSEIDYYDKILQFFSSKNRNTEETESWKESMIIELMKLFKKKEKSSNLIEIKNLIQNAIILILSLSENIPLDYYDTMGKDSKNLTLSEKKELKNKLYKLIQN